jgi:HPt (histidine-containing phosphotransfer) domain-containing protein
MSTKTNIHSLPVLNAEQVMRDMNDDGEIYREVAQVFLDDAHVQHGHLAAAGSDRSAVIAIIHEVANSLGIIGASRGEQAVRQAERQLLDNPAEDLAAAVATAMSALAEAQQALRAWLATSPP